MYSSAPRSTSFVSASRKYDPPKRIGRVRRRRFRRAIICCVRSASVAADSVGSAQASSSEFVCSDCVPPSTAASACIAVRTTLL